jgi:tetratricopeptide (TPR) repeat protein
MSKIDNFIRIKTLPNIRISRINFVKDRKFDYLGDETIRRNNHRLLRDSIVFKLFDKVFIKNNFYQKKLVPITVILITINALLGIVPESYSFSFVLPVLAQADQDIFAAGLEKLKQGEYANAIADFTEAIRLNPDNAKIYFNRAITYNTIGNPEKAIADLDRVILAHPDQANAYFNRGNSYGTLGNFPKALENYNQAIILDANNPLVYLNRGVIYWVLEDYQKAIADYDQAIVLDPRYALTYNNRGLVYQKLADFPQAIKNFNQAIRFHSSNSFFYINKILCDVFVNIFD